MLLLLLVGCRLVVRSVETDLDNLESLRPLAEETEGVYGDRVLAEYSLRFSNRFRKEALSGANATEVQWLFDAAYFTSMATLANPETMPLSDLRQALAELGRRDRAFYAYGVTYDLLIKARRFEEAQILFERHRTTAMESLPEILEAKNAVAGPRVMEVDLDRRVLRVRGIDLSAGPRIVVVSHPHCHFSMNAFLAVTQHPVLSRVFRQYALWLAPVPTGIDFDSLQSWNRGHPKDPTVIAWAHQEWPLPDLSATPTFYFLRDGAVVSRVNGWPREGHIAELVRAATDVGMVWD